MGEGTWTGADRGECWTAWRLCWPSPPGVSGRGGCAGAAVNQQAAAGPDRCCGRPACLPVCPACRTEADSVTDSTDYNTAHQSRLCHSPLFTATKGRRRWTLLFGPIVLSSFFFSSTPKAFKSVVVWFGLASLTIPSWSILVLFLAEILCGFCFCFLV